ncbi:hypothetical protein [Kribbella koreensis]
MAYACMAVRVGWIGEVGLGGVPDRRACRISGRAGSAGVPAQRRTGGSGV